MSNKLYTIILDITCFIGGTLLLIFSLLNFDHTNVSRYSFDNSITGYYYYQEGYIIGASIGAALIVLGFLIRSWRKQ
ncbi:MAG: hypothetical protein IPH11_04865 [Ignavibacteriales bacterium]|nr:hypothetical protein [Ignavibacteriales bacterium]